MKKINVFSILVLSFLFFVNNANAVLFTEAYTGLQYFNAPGSTPVGYNFGFDFFGVTHNITDSSLALTSAVTGVADPIVSASVYVDFTDDDQSTTERVNIRILLGNPPTTINPQIGSFTAEMSSGYNFSYTLDAAQLAILNAVGWDEIRVVAVPVSTNNNDFSVTRVAMTVDTATSVPEPATLMLLVSGLVGFAVLRRRKIKI